MYKYLRIGIISVTPMGDRNNYKFDIYKYVYKFVICDDMNKKKNVNDLK